MLQKIEKIYGIHIFSIQPIRDIYRLKTDQGKLCLKEIDYKLKKFLFIYYAMEHLINRGFHQLPAFVHTLTGDPYFSYNDRIFFISEWIDGRESDFKNPADLDLALITLAKMHRASIGFRPPSHVKVKSRLGIWPKRFHKRISDLKKFKEIALQKVEPSTFDKYYLKHVDKIIQEGEKALQLLEKSAYNELVKQAKKDGSFCHNDFVYHNVLIDDSIPAAYIIDFDYCRFDLRIYDIARLIRRIIKDKEFKEDLLDIILYSYNSEYPLLKEEYPVLAAFLQFPQRFWRIADRYYHQKCDWSDEKFHSHLKRAVRRYRYQRSLVKEILRYEKN
ncbi:hypothetical protein BBF96_10475 [Anoxybacter fermentans]|uniref:Aminoglycoside phosphotransferase domain-containing protein n=1 Tax=Anoxybacter fermentans TaxID=1323375 RepID=A0A3S9T2Z3_9FIRM|nr:hypothetical protein BBF96_10475 [Anoxybacter fermentans]